VRRLQTERATESTSVPAMIATTKRVADAEEVLEFWFADAATSPQALERRNKVWFSGGPRFDRACSDAFAATLAAAARGGLDHWKESPRGRLALILLLDQFSRNIHRGEAAAYSQDDRALAVCREGIERRHDEQLSLIERTFFYLPMEHAEDTQVQELSVQHFDALVDQAPEELRQHFEANAAYARQHQDIVARFGRFPHRNAVLGRDSTHEETTYLADHAPRFGQ
jgi:uncharacterized protein (DUF924 family)